MKLDKIDRAYAAELTEQYRAKAGKRAAPSRTIPVRGSARALRPPAKRVDAPAPDRTPELEAAFRRRGLTAESARIAARGRSGAQKPSSLLESFRRRGLSERAARVAAAGRRGVLEAVTKHEDPAGDFKGGDFPASDYAYVGDAADPETWALVLTVTPGGTPDPDYVKAAVQAITPGNPTPNPVPDSALPDVKAALAKAWTKAGLAADSLPEILTTEALRRSFRRLGLSETAATVAASGRGRRL
jgi:hypothetical protein